GELDEGPGAGHMALYGQMLAKEAHAHLPTPVKALGTRRLLTMNWLDGEPILKFVDSHLEQRNQLAHNMFRAWYVPFYYYGVIHGDPHLGNYTVREGGDINLLDFGCIRTFKPSFVRGVIDLYHALMRNDEALAVHAYETWGFKNLARETIAVLNRWAAYVYAPLMDDRARKIQDTSTGIYGRDIAETVHQDLRQIGGVT